VSILYTPDPEKRKEVLSNLRDIVAFLNDTSPECLSAIDSIQQMELEAEVERLKGALLEIASSYNVTPEHFRNLARTALGT
jgi:GTP1/Obg family GTP-binding protein